MTNAPKPTLYLKRSCPFCLKLRIFLTEAGLADRFHYTVFDDGDEMHLSRARVGLKDGAITSDAPVNVTAGNTTLTADHMEIGPDGEKITFKGNVVMTLQPEREGSSPAATAP